MCGLPVLVFSAGMCHSAFSTSTCSHRASISSDFLTSVSKMSRSATLNCLRTFDSTTALRNTRISSGANARSRERARCTCRIGRAITGLVAARPAVIA